MSALEARNIGTVNGIDVDVLHEVIVEIHENVIKTSPNYFNVSRPVRIDAQLQVEN